MSKSVFKDPAAYSVAVSDDESMPIIAELTVGETKREFMFFGPVRSSQTDRVQLEVAADGTMYATVGHGSVGACSINLLEAIDPCTEPDKSSTSGSESTRFALQCYAKEMTTIKNREIALSLYASDSGKTVPVGTFKGLAVGVDVDVRYTEGGVLLFITTLRLVGTWKND